MDSIRAQIRPFTDPATDDLFDRCMACLARYKTPVRSVRWQIVTEPDTTGRRKPSRWSKVA